MADKTVKTRVQLKGDTTANWDLAKNFHPLKNELLIYTDSNKLKVGDGTKIPHDLSFVNAANADSATKLTTNAGSATLPVYFSEGKPVATSYTLGKNVPSNAEFTDTTYTFTSGTNGFTVKPEGGTAQTVSVTPSIANNITGSGTRTSGYLAKFNGTNTVTNGPAIGTSTTTYLRNDGTWATPPNTTYSAATTSNSGLMSAADKVKLNGIETGAQVNPTDYIVSGSLTTTSTADSGNNIYTFTSADGSTSTFTVKNGSKGSSGTSVTVSSSAVTYQASTSGTTIPTGSWSTSVPSVPKGLFLWTKTVVTYSDSKTATSYSVGYMGTNGGDGPLGPQGPKGDKGDTGPAGPAGTNATTTAIGTASTAGLTKLYTSTGTGTDGTMTRTAITNAINNISAGAKYSTSSPSNPTAGLLWFNPNAGYLLIYSGSSWVAIGAVWK